MQGRSWQSPQEIRGALYPPLHDQGSHHDSSFSFFMAHHTYLEAPWYAIGGFKHKAIETLRFLA